MKYLYIFGSYVRGEFDNLSDVDMLLISSEDLTRSIDLNKFSLYKPDRVIDLFREGNPFAWHLYFESKLVFSYDGKDFLKELGKPCEYKNMRNDLVKFQNLFDNAKKSLLLDNSSVVFDLGTIFLSIRNFATCFSLGHFKEPNFSRDSCLKLNSFSLDIAQDNYDLMKKCRILSTRGIGGEGVTKKELIKFVDSIPIISTWFEKIKIEADV